MFLFSNKLFHSNCDVSERYTEGNLPNCLNIEFWACLVTQLESALTVPEAKCECTEISQAIVEAQLFLAIVSLTMVNGNF
jgi:hypothetical protein